MTSTAHPPGPRCSTPTAGVPRHAHLGWFALLHRYATPGTYVHETRSRECLGLVLHAEGRLTSIVGGRASSHELRRGMVGIVPPDHAGHTVVVEAGAPTAAFLLLVPWSTVARIAEQEGVKARGAVGDEIAFTHPMCTTLLEHLGRLHGRGVDASLAADDAGRALVLEALRLGTGAAPEWAGDRGVFDAATMAGIVAAIDATFAARPRLDQLAAPTGLSPGHFARKFRCSTGLSIERFVNHRRVAAALRSLASDDVPLARLAVRLGFNSHSHLTRVFSALTGMTPAAYRHGLRAPLTRQPRREKWRSVPGGLVPRATFR